MEYFYEVCEAESISTLKSIVEPLLDVGWKLAGGVSVTSYRDSSGEIRVLYCQALIAEMKVEDDEV